MSTLNSHEIHFEITSSEKRSGPKKKGDSKWFAKSLRGKTLPDSPFKTDLEINTMVFGETGDYPAGFEAGEQIKMYIDKLEFKKRKIYMSGELIFH